MSGWLPAALAGAARLPEPGASPQAQPPCLHGHQQCLAAASMSFLTLANPGPSLEALRCFPPSTLLALHCLSGQVTLSLATLTVFKFLKTFRSWHTLFPLPPLPLLPKEFLSI